MSPQIALESSIFLAYLQLTGGLLAGAGLILLLLRHWAKKELRSVWRTYRSWWILAPIVLGTIFAGRAAMIVGVAVLGIFSFKEFARATGLYADWWFTGAVYLGIAAVGASALIEDPRTEEAGWYGLFMTLPVYIVSLLIIIPILRNRAHGQLQRVSLAVLGFIYLGWMFGHLAFLANSTNPYGYLLFLVFAVEANDIAAFTCGKLFGHRKLCPEISPNKTVGGALGALFVSMAMPWLLWFSFPHFEVHHLLVTGLIVGVGGQLGDLAISFIKRDIGIKDTGALIPGHGGLLDRVDSLIFVAPLFFHAVRWFFGLRGA